MKTLCLLLAVTLCSAMGWKLGQGFGLMVGYLFSFVGSLVGVVLGWFVNTRYLNR